MKYIDVKGLAKPVSELILGLTWADPKQQERFDETVDMFLAKGGTLLDAGRFYGVGGECEVCLRRWLKNGGDRERLMLTDKCCHPFVAHDGSFSESSRWRVSPELITEDLEFSLDRVGAEYFDLYLMHRDDTSIPVADLMDRLELHYREGRISAYGVSNWTMPRVMEAQAYCRENGYAGISAVSQSYSLATVTRARWKDCVFIDDEAAAAYTRERIPLLSYSSLGAGFFGQLPERLAIKDLSEAYCTDVNFEKLRRATALAEKHGCSATNIALAYILNQGLLLAAITGPRTPDELADSIRALDIALTRDEIEYLSLRSGSPD